jgi:flagellar protein FliS
MTQATPNAYLRTQIMTAGPMQLRMLLFDGAVKFARHGREALANSDFEQSYNNISRTQNIVWELSNGLNHEQAPDLCDRLTALYNYMYRRLVEANMHRDPAIVDEVIELLEYERETWRQLMEKVGEEQQTNGQSEPANQTAPPAGAYANPAGDGRSSTLSKSA